jgi:hypothetical protein
MFGMGIEAGPPAGCQGRAAWGPLGWGPCGEGHRGQEGGCSRRYCWPSRQTGAAHTLDCLEGHRAPTQGVQEGGRGALVSIRPLHGDNMRGKTQQADDGVHIDPILGLLCCLYQPRPMPPAGDVQHAGLSCHQMAVAGQDKDGKHRAVTWRVKPAWW